MRRAPLMRSPTRLAALAAAALVAAALAGAVELTGALDRLERGTLTTRFALRHVPRPSDVVVVGVDDGTFGVLKRQWPFPRSFHADAVARLHAAGAREIVYDVQFTEPTTPSEDLALYDAIGNAGGATLATTEVDSHGHTNVLGGDANLAAINARAAAANLANAAGGVVTHYPYAVAGLKTIAVVAAERAAKHVPRSRFSAGSAWIDYRGGPGTFREVPFWKVVRGAVPASVFRGKVVVVGATAPTLQDVHATPLGSDLMSGPEVQANAIWTALHGNPLASAPSWATLVAILLAALAAPLAAVRVGVLRAAVAGLVVAGAYALTAQLAFDAGLILAVVSPLVAAGLGIAGMIGASYVTARSEGRRLAWTVRRRSEQLRDAQLEIVQRLARATESRDEQTGQHIDRIGYLCERLASKIGMSRAEALLLRHASAMHDIGKIAIPDRILLKPSRLTDDEWELMKTHTMRGAEILAGSTSPLMKMAETIARTHHERWDGSGYPAGLRGEEIPLAGRICAVCDVFDALISERPYKDAWPPAHALAELRRSSGSHLDPALVDAFLELAPELERDAEPADLEALGLEALPPLIDPARVDSRLDV